ncbi:MAG: hypothetical protein M3360_09690 [Actinomycetota bacterium]|nr:hypothetical protein [Actinomycetota bacterium]
MIRTSYLRAYERASCFSQAERDRWLGSSAVGDSADAGDSRKWLISASMPGGEPFATTMGGAIVRRVDGRTFLCPHRTRLRMLAGLLAFRTSVPEEVADAFVPEDEARRAAAELAALADADPRVRSHILHANWHVPLRWFTAFDPLQRILTEDKDGLRLRYESDMVEAKGRLARSLEVLDEAPFDESVVDAVRELASWMEQFADDGLLELDYGTVAGLFLPEDLVDDHSAAELWSSLDALAAGDIPLAERLFSQMADKWTFVRSSEVVN